MRASLYIRITACLLGLLVACASRGSVPAPVLDQSQLLFQTTLTVAGNGSIAQTFTPALAGNLAFVDLYLGRNNPNESNPLNISITGVQAGSPGQVLGSLTQTFLNSGGPAWYRYDFSSLSLPLNANSVYAIVLSNPGSTAGIGAGAAISDFYTRGQALASPGGVNPWTPAGGVSDLMFATYLTPVPEPTPLVLGLLGLAILARLYRPHLRSRPAAADLRVEG